MPMSVWKIGRFALYCYPEGRRGPFGRLFPGGLSALPTLPEVRGESEIGVEFIPAARAAHEHSPDICRDTKGLVTSFALFDDVIFHGYCIGRGLVTI